MANKKLEIAIVLPEQNLDGVAGKLVKLTEAIAKIDTDLVAHGCLGGEFGYGAEYENDIFMMKPFCWCDKQDCPWCLGCFCKYHIDKNDKYITDKRCDNHDKIPAPNFVYKPTGYRVNWYKWIGRSMEAEGELPREWYANCLKSLSK